MKSIEKNKENIYALLKEKSHWVWEETIRIHDQSPETRVASSLSPIEIFVTLYYGGFIKFNPKEPLWENRDRCIISKGHGSLCMYPILADLKFFSLKELNNVCKSGSFLGGIPDPIIPGYETINGSLGHGVGVGTGIAYALKEKKKEQAVYVVTGDGELHEGSNWEAFMFAAQHNLNNLTVIVDNNQISMLGHTAEIIDHIDLVKKLDAFGWHTLFLKDGHNSRSIHENLCSLQDNSIKKPKALIVNTNKGNKVPGLENTPLSHVTAISKDTINKLLNKEES